MIDPEPDSDTITNVESHASLNPKGFLMLVSSEAKRQISQADKFPNKALFIIDKFLKPKSTSPLS